MPPLPGRFRLVSLGDVDSTNAEARRRADTGAADGTLIRAARQLAGRGRQGRTWTSPAGNLYMSLILRPACPPAAAANLGFIAAVALADALGEVLPGDATVTCKWPNDVLVDGRKVAGILVESATSNPATVDWAIIGMGVNVAWHPAATDSLYPPTSLAACGAGVTPDALLACLARHLERTLERWQGAGFAPVRAAWLARAHALGGPLSVRLDGGAVSGLFRDIDGDGALVLEVDGTPRRIAVGDVFPAHS